MTASTSDLKIDLKKDSLPDPGFAAFWGVRQSPFLGRVDVPAGLLLAGQRGAASRALIAAQEGASVVTIAGRDGAGSTVLARWLYESLPETSHHALLLAPGAAGADPAALSSRIAAFGVGQLGVPAPNPERLAGSLREQMIALAPVFDSLRNTQKRLAVIFDNSAYLSGEPWAAYMLAVVRQGEIVDGVIQFFLFGNEDGIDRLTSSWPRALEARAIKVALPSPSNSDQATWIENRLVIAGCEESVARNVFSRSAIQRAIAASSQNLARLGRIAEGAMIEAFLSGSRQVTESHVEIASTALGRGGASIADAAGDGIETHNAHEKLANPRLLDLLKPI